MYFIFVYFCSDIPTYIKTSEFFWDRHFPSPLCILNYNGLRLSSRNKPPTPERSFRKVRA
jgi:hypothetical protein